MPAVRRVPGAKALRAAVGRVRSRIVRSGLILGYHRIAHLEHDPYTLAVAPAHFAEQMEVVARSMCPLPLGELSEVIARRRIPPRAIAITFDDAYLDVFEAAAPVLRGLGIPATVFVVSGALGCEYWWDRLARSVPHTADAAASAAARLHHEVQGWAENRRFLSALHSVGASPRTSVIVRIYDLLLDAPVSVRERVIAALEESTDAPRSPASRAMTRAELRQLADDRLFEIGAHSVTHPRLGRLGEAEQRREIEVSRAEIAEIIGRPVRGFSYPNGSLGRSTARLARSAGLSYACTSVAEAAWHGSDVHRLPRAWPGDWDSSRFEPWLRSWTP